MPQQNNFDFINNLASRYVWRPTTPPFIVKSSALTSVLLLAGLFLVGSAHAFQVDDPAKAKEPSAESTKLVPVPLEWLTLPNPKVIAFVDCELGTLREAGVEVQPLFEWVAQRLGIHDSPDVEAFSELMSEVQRFRFGCSELKVLSLGANGFPSSVKIPDSFYLRMFFNEGSIPFEDLKSKLDPNTRKHYVIRHRKSFPFSFAEISVDDRWPLLAAIGSDNSMVLGSPSFLIHSKRNFTTAVRLGFGNLLKTRGMGLVVDLGKGENVVEPDFLVVSLGSKKDYLNLRLECSQSDEIGTRLTDFQAAVLNSPKKLTEQLENEAVVPDGVAKAIVDAAKVMKLKCYKTFFQVRVPLDAREDANLILKKLLAVAGSE